MDLTEHLKTARCSALMIEDTPLKGLENVFSGRVGNAKDRDIFCDMDPKHLKPVSALNNNLYKIETERLIKEIDMADAKTREKESDLIIAQAEYDRKLKLVEERILYSRGKN